jgi:hypothetical protein
MPPAPVWALVDQSRSAQFGDVFRDRRWCQSQHLDELAQAQLTVSEKR